MKKKQKRGTDAYGKWNDYDDFEVDLSFSWLGICIITLAIGLFIFVPRVPIVGIIWVVAESIYLFKKIREALHTKARERKEVVEEEKPPYHIQLAMEQERRQAEAKAQEQAAQTQKALEQLEVQKRSGLISQKEYDSRRQDLLSSR